MAKLYIIATPIGNLGDITYRAIETLKEADLILCEDTRRTKKLLDHYKIKKPLLSYHQRSKLSRIDKIIEHLENGKNLALVTDAGTPGISDPGNELIEAIFTNYESSTPACRRGRNIRKKKNAEIQIIPIPGPSALTASTSVAGVNMSKFVFLGFPPNKKGRETFFKKVLGACYPVVYYESPYRFIKNLKLLQELKDKVKLNLIVGRELTKIHEEITRGNVGEVLKYYENNPDKIKGEFCVIVAKVKAKKYNHNVNE